MHITSKQKVCLNTLIKINSAYVQVSYKSSYYKHGIIPTDGALCILQTLPNA